MGRLKALVVALVGLVIQHASPTIPDMETPRMSSGSDHSTFVPPELAATNTLTINQCDQPQELGFSRTPNDCVCPYGYAKLRKEATPFCIGLRSPGPWRDECVTSGTATDFYDLLPDEKTQVRVFLAAHGVTDCWISARRIAPGGALVSRLAGSRWNEPILPNAKKGSLTLELSETIPPADLGCASIGGAQFGQLLIRNCSQRLHQLCLYRETPLLRLHCNPGEYTTRYAAPEQRYCYSVHEQDLDNPLPFGGSAELDRINVTSARIQHLKDTLLEQFSAMTRKPCLGEVFSRSLPIHKAVKRAQNVLSNASGNHDPFGCVVAQRDTLPPTEEQMPSMHLYFDKARHKLLLTVYGGSRLWRAVPKDVGFRCFTNADGMHIRTAKTSKLRKLPQQKRHTHRREEEITDNDGDEDNGDLASERTMYEVRLADSGSPGHYWCEGHAVPGLKHLVSQQVIAGRRPDGKSFFSALIELHLNRSDAESMTLSHYERQIDTYIKRHRDRRSEWRPVFDALKSWQVKRIEAVLHSAKDVGHDVRLVLHVIMKRVKSWRDFPTVPELTANEIELPEKYMYYYKMRWYLNSALKSLIDDQFRLFGVNSTEFCLPDSLRLLQGGNIWWVGRLGETVASKNLCLVEDTGLPLTRRCLGDFLYGCGWEPEQSDDGRQCSNLQHEATRALYEYSTAQLNRSMLPSVFQTVGDMLSMPISVLPADLFYMSKTLENVRQVLIPGKVDELDELVAAPVNASCDAPACLPGVPYYCNITDIMNRFMYVNRTVVIRSQLALNTTNILVDAIETMINELALANDSAVLLRGSQFDCDWSASSGQQPEAGQLAVASYDGTLLFRSPRLIVLIVDPSVANISGMALLRNVRSDGDAQTTIAPEAELYEEGDFSNFKIRYLYKNQSQQALFDEDDLEVGSFVPESVLESLGPLQDAMVKTDDEVDQDETYIPESTTQPVSPAASTIPPPALRIVVMIYYNDRAFRETKNGTIARPNSKIISITIPGYGSRMPDEIPIYIRQHEPDRESRCGYWSFDGSNDSSSEFGSWSYDECRLVNASASGVLTLCGCYHLTSFSRLTMDTQMVETVGVSKKLIADKSSLALDIITVIGCSLSLVGVIGILVTAILFPSWRIKASSKILLQLSCAIAIEMIIIFFEGPDIDKHGSTLDEIECALLGSVFHYIILVTFMWMLVSAYLQFMRYVKVLGRLRPSHFILKATMCCWGLPALPVISFLILDYRFYLKQDNFSDICYPHGSALYYGLLLPIGTIIFLNFTSFVFVLYNIFTIPSNLTKTVDHDMTLAQLRLSVFLFFLLGLPWIFGMLTTGSADKLFAYLFCLTAPLQGFVLFVYFILMDPIARRLWLHQLHRLPCLAQLDKPLDEKETTSPSTSFNTHL